MGKTGRSGPADPEKIWEVSYTLRYPDTTRKTWVRDLEVTDSAGVRYDVDKIQISPIGLRLDITRYDPVPEEWPMQFFEAALQLTDGTVMELEGGGGQSFTHGDKKAKAYYSAMFAVPVALEEIEGLIVCGTFYPMDLE